MGADSWLLLLLLGGVMVVLTTEWVAIDVVAVALVVILVVAGILSPEEAFAGFANEFILVLCSIFVLSGALVRTGIIEWLGNELYRRARDGEGRGVGLVMSMSAGLSAFLSNTNVTAVLLPAVMEYTRRAGLSPSRLLIPLAYASMLGGAATLIGTSTNLAANGFLQRAGLEPYSLFEFLPVGLAMTLIGTLYMVTIGRRLLPQRAGTSLSAEYEIARYLSEVVLDPDSDLVGQTLRDAPLAEAGVKVLAILRGERHIFPGPGERLQAGDVLVVQANRDALLQAHDIPGLSLEAARAWDDSDLTDADVGLAEAIVLPRSSLAGRTLTQLRLRERYGVSVLAVHRRGHARPVTVGRLPLAVGDVLLLQGSKEQLELLGANRDVWVLGEVAHMRFRRRKGMLTLGAVLAAVAVGGAGWLPLSIAMLLAVLGIVLAGVIRADQIYGMVEWPLVVLIGGMTSMGLALQKTGTADLIASAITEWIAPFGLTVTMAVFALVTMALTQPMSNAAAALVMLPVAISTAHQMGVEPRSLAILVTLSASLSFVAPLEPACLLVFAPGKYRFRDFIVAGLPMTAITLVVLLLLVPLVWPLT